MINLAACLLGTIAPMDSGSIAASSATYDGALLILDGEVALDHNFGHMQAEKAVLTKEDSANPEFPFSAIELAESVHLKLSTDAEVECERAYLDFSKFCGTLTSPKNVHYSDSIQMTPFEIFSPHLDIQMVQENYDIQSAHARNGVHLIYDTLYHLTAESILFQDGVMRSEGEQECVWTHEQSSVKARTFNLDLTQKLLYLEKASGTLNSFSSGDVQFTSDHLSWDHLQHHLILKGMPQVHEASIGQICSDQQIDLSLKNERLSQIKALGQTKLVSLKGHTLTTNGSIDVDSDKMLATISSDATQLQYNEEEMSILADDAEIYFRDEKGRLHPERLELQGNIKIFSQEKQGPTRKGVADQVTYEPETRTCILKANPGRKVLFTREEDKMALSASEVHITYNPIAQQQEVRGVGHVTLSLTPHEQNLLNQVFKHVPSTP